MVNYLKDKNWQDVTLEELKEHWDMGINELPTPLTFDVARYMNAYVLGNIHGEGIDVRCSYQHEGAAIYHSKIKYDELREEFKKNGWVETDYDKWNAYFVKYDTEVVLHNKPHFNEVGYMEMNFRSDYSDDAYCIEDYYDHVEPKVEKKEEEQVDNHQRNPLHILKRCMSFLSEERGVAERFLEGNDAFTDTDCEYIISACQLLEKAIEIIEKSQGKDEPSLKVGDKVKIVLPFVNVTLGSDKGEIVRLKGDKYVVKIEGKDNELVYKSNEIEKI